LSKGVWGIKKSDPMSRKNIRGVINYNLDLKNFARENRKNPTMAETKIWSEILSNNKLGYRFLRQKPVDNFIVDFYCSKLLLAIEIDGDSHYQDNIYDSERTRKLNEYGIKVIRYINNEILNNLDEVYQNILAQIKRREKLNKKINN
jgi:very-short-patch-repair endonuclease